MSVFDGSYADSIKEGAEPQPPLPERKSGSPFEDLIGRVSSITPDSDVLLTAVLLWLLYKEGADTKLLLALAYIMI